MTNAFLSSREIRYLNARALIDRSGGVSAFAKKIDREQPQVSSFAGENPIKGIGARMARHIEACFGLASGWMDAAHFDEWSNDAMTAVQHQQMSKLHETYEVSEQQKTYSPWTSIPVVGTAQLGTQGYWDESQHPVGFGDGSIAWLTNDHNAYALKCVGDSMSPRIRHGEYVIIEPNHPVISGDEVLVKTEDGQSMIKVFLYERENRVHLDSVNNQYEQMVIARDRITKFHYVAGIAKATLHRE